jgi:hypothetical protein
VIFPAKSISDFYPHTATTPAMKIRSGKTGHRFSSRNRIAIFPEKTFHDFFDKNGTRSKMPPADSAAVVRCAGACVQMWLTFHDRIAIFSGKLVGDFSGKINQRFSVFDRGRYRE